MNMSIVQGIKLTLINKKIIIISINSYLPLFKRYKSNSS